MPVLKQQQVEKEKIFEPTLHVCANCIYFDKFPVQKKVDNLLGACHCNPPQPVMPDPFETDDTNKVSKLGVFPLVLGSWQCGMWFDKNKPRD